MKVVLGAVLNFDSYEDLIVACQEVIDENRSECEENGGMPEYLLIHGLEKGTSKLVNITVVG